MRPRHKALLALSFAALAAGGLYRVKAEAPAPPLPVVQAVERDTSGVRRLIARFNPGQAEALTVEVYRVDAPVVSTMRRLTPALAALPFGASKIATAIDAAESGSQVEQLLIPLKSGHASYADFSRGRVAGAISLLSKVRPETSRAGGRILSEPPAVPDGDSADRQGAIDDSADIEDNLIYMRRIADECKKRGVPLLFWLAPIDGDPVQSQMFARAQAQLQLEYPEVQYLDMNSYTEEIGLNSSDFRDEGHLYVWGAEKSTRWLGSYLLDAGLVEVRPNHKESEWWDRSAEQWAIDVDAAVRESPVRP